MIYQIQHQNMFDLDETVLIAQAEPAADVDLAEFISDWLADVKPRHPLPEGWQWLCCTEGYEHFKVGVVGVGKHGRERV